MPERRTHANAAPRAADGATTPGGETAGDAPFLESPAFLLRENVSQNVNISVTTWNRPELTFRCLKALRDNTKHPFFLTVIDNGSEPAMRESLQRLADGGEIDALILHRRNMGIAVSSNTGWQTTRCPYYVKLDNDMLVRDPGWLDELIALVEEGGFMAAAFRACPWHGVEPAVLPSGRPYDAAQALGGGCILIPRSTFERAGFWNEDYRYGWEDLDYTNRLLLLEGRLAYMRGEHWLEHLGASDVRERPDYQDVKSELAGALYGPKSLFLLNMMLFELGLRPLAVPRKFLPRAEKDGTVAYVSNPAYAPIVARQNLFRQRFIQGQTGNDLYLGLPDLPK